LLHPDERTELGEAFVRVTELDEIRRETARASARAAALCAGLDAESLAWRPRPDAWSIAEILAHLERTTEVFLPGLEEAIARARRRRQLASGPFHLNAWGRLLVWYVEPPPPVRLPAPRPLRPAVGGDPLGALPRFLISQEWFLSRLPELEGIDLARATYISPIARYIRMSVLAFLRVHVAHERRHLWQGENVRRRVHEARLG